MDPSSIAAVVAAPVPSVSAPSLPAASPARSSHVSSSPSPLASPSSAGAAVAKEEGATSGRKGSTSGRGGPPGARRAAQQLAPPAPNSCIVLKNLDYKISQAELEEVVRRVAGGRKEFVNLSLIEDKATGNFRGMAFVNFHSVEDATTAMGALGKMSINNRKVVAEFRRLRPGERERREMNERRQKKYDLHQTRTTFESDVAAEFDADGNAVDKRLIFFQKRDNVRKADDLKRVAEKETREKEKENEFRRRLLAYRDADVADGAEIEDITFESDLTSFERRMVHVLCDDLDLGHISKLTDDGVRVLTVTKHPQRKEKWAVETAEIRATANERKVAEAEEKRRKKEAKREAQRAAAAADKAADNNNKAADNNKAAAERPSGDARASSPEWKKGETTTTGGPVTKEELEGIKWFKPRSAKAADGEQVNASNAIRVPQYKLYTPPRQPTGPDGTVGFQSRRPAPAENGGADGEQGEAEGDVDAPGAEGKANASPTSTQDVGEGEVEVEAAVSADDTLKASGSQTLLNPSVPAFTPSAAYAI